MSIDTIRAGVAVDLSKLDHFEKEISTIDITTGEIKRKYVTLGMEGEKENKKIVPRLTYYRTAQEGYSGYLNFEVSLPKMLLQENYTVISDEQTEEALSSVASWIQDKLHIRVPGWGLWQVSRLDACHAWQVGDDMQFYFGALKECPVPGYTRVPYESDGRQTEGFSWIAKTLRVNGYDKGQESGKKEAQGMLRMEVQELNKDSCSALASRIGTGRSVDDLVQGEIARSLLRSWLKRIGMGDRIYSKADIFEKISIKYGAQQAASRLFFIEGYKRFGSSLKTKSWYSEASYKRNLSEAKKAGWLVDSQKELEGLKL